MYELNDDACVCELHAVLVQGAGSAFQSSRTLSLLALDVEYVALEGLRVQPFLEQGPRGFPDEESDQSQCHSHASERRYEMPQGCQQAETPHLAPAVLKVQILARDVGECSLAWGKDIRAYCRSSLSFLKDKFLSRSSSAHSFHFQSCFQNNRCSHLVNHLTMFTPFNSGLEKTLMSFMRAKAFVD